MEGTDWTAVPYAISHFLATHNLLTDPKAVVSLAASFALAVITGTIKMP